MQLVAHGLYTVKDRYFTEFGNGYWVDNKQEGRPYYYLFHKLIIIKGKLRKKRKSAASENVSIIILDWLIRRSECF